MQKEETTSSNPQFAIPIQHRLPEQLLYNQEPDIMLTIIKAYKTFGINKIRPKI